VASRNGDANSTPTPPNPPLAGGLRG
jgi:hypothetical protein